MIDINYKLTEVDYLQLHFYIFDVDGCLRKKSRNMIFIFISFIAILILFFIYKNENIYAFSLTITTFIILLYHKQSMKNKFKKILTKNIQLYKNRFDKFAKLKFTENEIEVKSIAGYTNIYQSQIVSISEIKDYFFIRLQPEAIIIPKSELENVEIISEYLKTLTQS